MTDEDRPSPMPTLMSAAASAVTASLRDGPDTPLSAPTPCRDWDLGTLVHHVAGTTTGLARIGRKEALDPGNPWSGPETSADDWRRVLTGRIEDLARAWSTDDAWSGSVEMSGTMPASTLGDMAYAEILLHGWDVARATGTELAVSPDLARELLRGVEETAELGRKMGAYGAAVEVPADARDFDRALAAAGRDPQWRPPSG